jgi:hypothetical protein
MASRGCLVNTRKDFTFIHGHATETHITARLIQSNTKHQPNGATPDQQKKEANHTFP